MKICILCEDRWIDGARAKAENILPKFASQTTAKLNFLGKPEPTHLKIPLSPSGELPATHWFCAINVNSDTYQKMLAAQEHTIIEEAVPSEFLEKHGLKKIVTFGPNAVDCTN